MAESEGSLVLAECSVFTDMLTVVSDWEEVDDEKITDAMRSLDKWQQQMNILERTSHPQIYCTVIGADVFKVLYRFNSLSRIKVSSYCDLA